MTKGFSGAELENIVNEARFQSLKIVEESINNGNKDATFGLTNEVMMNSA